MTVQELHDRYHQLGWSHEQILDIILSFMSEEEIEDFVTILDSIGEQQLEMACCEEQP